MAQQSSIQASADAIRKLWEKHGIKPSFRLLGFCLSLLPVPVIQQAGAALDRYLSDKALEEELARVWSQVKLANATIAKVETLEAAIAEIAQTVESNKEVFVACQHVSATLASSGSQFVLDTTDHSYQKLVNSVVQAGRVLISATSFSTNVLENTKVISPSTHLQASGGSSNFVDGTTFTDNVGTVGMQGISTQGDVFVSGASVGFGVGGVVAFGGNPDEVSANCTLCGGRITADRRRLVGYTSIQCPHCSRVLPFGVG